MPPPPGHLTQQEEEHAAVRPRAGQMAVPSASPTSLNVTNSTEAKMSVNGTNGTNGTSTGEIRDHSRALLSKRASAPTASSAPSHGGIPAPQTLTFSAFSRTGGAFVADVLTTCVRTPVNILENDEPPSSHDTAGSFVIATMRNPFDWYPSVWASAAAAQPNSSCCFASDLSPQERRALWSHCDGSGVCVAGSALDGVDRFRKWVRRVAHDGVGGMSRRFRAMHVGVSGATPAHNVHAEDWTRHSDELHTAARIGARGDKARDAGGSAAGRRTGSARGEAHVASTTLFGQSTESGIQLDKSGVHCWIRSESLEAELTQCLHRYEMWVSRWPGSNKTGTVDWDAFRKRLAQPTSYHERHAASRVGCSSLYDDATRAFVAKVDGALLKAFGYEPKCLHELPLSVSPPPSKPQTPSTQQTQHYEGSDVPLLQPSPSPQQVLPSPAPVRL